MAASSASLRADSSRLPGERSGLKQYYETLRERWWLVLLCTLVTFFAAVIYVAVAPRSYTARAWLWGAR